MDRDQNLKNIISLPIDRVCFIGLNVQKTKK